MGGLFSVPLESSSILSHEPCFAKGLVHPTLLHGLESFSGNAHDDLLIEFRYKDGLLLEVDLIALCARWVEFGGARAV